MTNKPTDLPISLFSKIFSTLSEDYKSINTENFNAIKKIFKFFGKLGTFVMDRGFDDKKIMHFFVKNDLKFVIRGKVNRTVTYNGKRINIHELAKKFKGKYHISLQMKGKTVDCYCSFVQIEVSDVQKPIYAVFVYFKNKTTIFYTNRELKSKEDAMNVIKKYYMRWRIEEYFKYKKQRFGFENYRIRTLNRMNALNLMITLAITAIYLLVSSSATIKQKLIEVAKVIRKEVFFEYYRITDGLKEVLSHMIKGINNKKEKSSKYVQMTLFDMTLFDVRLF